MNDKLEITLEELNDMPEGSYELIDIRNESAISYGKIPGALEVEYDNVEVYITRDAITTENQETHDNCSCLQNNEQSVSPSIFDNHNDNVDTKITYILYCDKGVISLELAGELRSKGIICYSLTGGYLEYLKRQIEKDLSNVDERAKDIEISIRKKFHKSVFSKFAKAVVTYELIKPNDHIAVCISGGKDSMLMAKLFQELQRHNKYPFELTFLVMDPGYSPANRQLIEDNARMMNIPITIFDSNIFDSVDQVEKSPCYLCARMRRGYLYSKAKELGCNKIALGHHYDDVIETILMGMLYGGQVQTMMPKLHSTNFEGMELIRPLYLIREADIKHWRDYNGLHFLQCACHFTDTCSSCRDDGTSNSKRLEIKKLIEKLKEVNPFVEANIFKSVENVSLSTIIAYKEDGVRHHFLETYDEKGFKNNEDN